MKRRAVVAMMLIFLFCFSAACYAEEATLRASELITDYTCNISNNGTTVTAFATVNAKGVCDQLGFTSLIIQEYRDGRWMTVSSKYNQYKYNVRDNVVSLSYGGKSGAKYRAQCKAYAKEGTESDTASYTTGTKTLP